MISLSISDTDNGPLLVQVDDIFTAEQCQKLIAVAEDIGFKPIDNDVAQYGRVTIIRPDLARALHQRLQSYMPRHIDGNPITGLNDHFRFSKYHPGQQFKIHKDGINQDSSGARSALTLNIFLNDDFAGGSTDFFRSKNEADLRFSVTPATGRGALFFAQQYHCGKEVTSGFKYLLRTDVMVMDAYNVRR